MDLSAPQNCLCFNLRRAARVVSQAYDSALKPAGLTAPQFSLLAMASGGDPLTMHGLADALGMDRTTLTRNLKPLIREGLVDVVTGGDQRQRLVSLSRTGVKRLALARKHWRTMQDDMVQSFGETESAALLQALGRIAIRGVDHT